MVTIGESGAIALVALVVWNWWKGRKTPQLDIEALLTKHALLPTLSGPSDDSSGIVEHIPEVPEILEAILFEDSSPDQ